MVAATVLGAFGASITFGVGEALAAGTVTTASAGAVTITTSFENSPISLDTTDAVGYAFTNTTGSTQTVTFTDTLPGGVTLDNPVAPTTTNGSGACALATPSANPGSPSLTATVTVPAAAGTVCTVSFDVVAGTPSNDVPVTDTYSAVSTGSGVVPTTTPGSLIVLSNPTLSFTSPVANQSFYLGQVVDASFSCAATDPLDSIDSFFGTDDEGNQIESGAPIDTLDPGTRTLEVDCYSAAGGGAVSQTVSYQVGSYALTAVSVLPKNDFVTFSTLVPAGTLVAKVFYGRKVLGSESLTITTRASVPVTVKPTPAGRRLLAALRGRSVEARLQVSFDPQPLGSGDQELTPSGATVISSNVLIPLEHPAAQRPQKSRKGRSSPKGRHARQGGRYRSHRRAPHRRTRHAASHRRARRDVRLGHRRGRS